VRGQDRIVALSAVLVFAVGAMVGVLGSRVLNTENEVRTDSGGRGGRRFSPEEYRSAYVNFMAQRLELMPEQVRQLGMILDDARSRMDQLMSHTIPQQETIRARQYEKIREILSEEQFAAFNRLRKERDDRNKGRR
jgi:hypothetical protein